KWFKPNGPIFFYCGNEGGIDGFWNNTGLIFELAPSFNAFVLFAEHVCIKYIHYGGMLAAYMRAKYPHIIKGALAASAPVRWVAGYKQLSNDLRLCKPVQNDFEFYWVLKWARNAFVMMAMLDYPYKASFMASLPANPVNVSCKIALSVADLIPTLREAVGVFYNSSQCMFTISRCFLLYYSILIIV
ncbi:unnamed protein product, partial [Schistosoma curassoni]|uniref:Alpha/beta-Hydrolases superfamily protein n=1 Tax=Schistosoma curassoni TaxID=6186 RepID=A0A183L0U4_9TREM